MENFQKRGGGGNFYSKNYFADFGPLKKAFFFGRFPKKVQHNFPKMREGEWGQRLYANANV